MILIIAVSENECTILNIKGNILFQGELEGNGIESIMPAKGWRTYHVIFRDKIVKMMLKFWINCLNEMMYVEGAGALLFQL